MSCLPSLLLACGEAGDETSAQQVLTVMLAAGARQHHSFLDHFNKNVAAFLSEIVLVVYDFCLEFFKNYETFLFVLLISDSNLLSEASVDVGKVDLLV